MSISGTGTPLDKKESQDFLKKERERMASTKALRMKLYNSQKGKGFSDVGKYKNNLKDGIWTEWYRSFYKSKLESFLEQDSTESKIILGAKERNSIGYGEVNKSHGCIKLVTNYTLGVKEGNSIGYGGNNEIQLECCYKDGELNGHLTEWWENGERKLDCDYKNGELNGRLTEWWKNGERKRDCDYKNGMKTGEEVFHNTHNSWKFG